MPLPVQLLLLQEHRRPKVLVCHTHHYDRQGGEDEVKDEQIDGIDGGGARESIEDLIVEKKYRKSLQKRRRWIIVKV